MSRPDPMCTDGVVALEFVHADGHVIARGDRVDATEESYVIWPPEGGAHLLLESRTLRALDAEGRVQWTHQLRPALRQ